ncbi:hypothetical protein VTP01DRAFT_3414 [Rhizomucor pusillus]|uniref:uncharacterized protein n=1 Tax=Rhizomucor pusillus TaxID=4840 RepID=UPI003742CA74
MRNFDSVLHCLARSSPLHEKLPSYLGLFRDDRSSRSKSPLFMPALQDVNDRVAFANKQPCLVSFLDKPIKFKSNDLDLVIDYYSLADMSDDLKEWTFDLVKSNMYDLYANSKDGWDDEQKRAEMRVPEARYLVARSADDPSDRKGFLYFRMIHEETMDDNVMAQTAYCFEVQVVPSARGRGLGEFLMQLLWQIGHYWKMDKVMLTVFKANKEAFRFYTGKMGFELDEISPGACLSALMARKFDYEILSKSCVADT